MIYGTDTTQCSVPSFKAWNNTFRTLRASDSLGHIRPSKIESNTYRLSSRPLRELSRPPGGCRRWEGQYRLLHSIAMEFKSIKDCLGAMRTFVDKQGQCRLPTNSPRKSMCLVRDPTTAALNWGTGSCVRLALRGRAFESRKVGWCRFLTSCNLRGVPPMSRRQQLAEAGP